MNIIDLTDGNGVNGDDFAKINGDNTKTFKVKDAVASDDAMAFGQLSKSNIDPLNIDAGTLDGLDSTDFVTNKNFLNFAHMTKWQGMLSGGGTITWKNSKLSTSERFIFIPTNASGGYINVNLSDLHVPEWYVAYIDLTEQQLEQSNLHFTQDDVVVEYYDSYTQTSSAYRLVIGYHNEDNNNFVFSNGVSIKYGKTEFTLPNISYANNTPLHFNASLNNYKGWIGGRKDYLRAVIPLVELTDGATTRKNAFSYTSGRFELIRPNGCCIQSSVLIDIKAIKKYNSELMDLEAIHLSTDYVKECTFRLNNGRKWGGLEVYYNAQAHDLYFTGISNCPILGYYAYKDTRDDSSVNDEIFNSIEILD